MRFFHLPLSIHYSPTPIAHRLLPPDNPAKHHSSNEMATRFADPMAKSKACANCDKIDSAFSCSNCKIQHIGDIQIFYCSQTCQKDHWKAHKAICVSRKQFGRAVAIVDELYIAFEEATFDRNSVLQREQNGNIYITRNPYDEAERVIGKSLIRSFPDEVAPPGTREEILQAILFDSQYDLNITASFPRTPTTRVQYNGRVHPILYKRRFCEPSSSTANAISTQQLLFP